MSKIRISICIPTYNRANILKRRLSHILKSNLDEIEILICDNASIDNTEAVVKSFKDPRINYHCNSENLGYDGNIIKCAEYAKGEFIFFLSDEDIINLDIFPRIIKNIKDYPNISQIISAIGDLREGKKRIYFNPGNRYLKAGYESLTQMFFATYYMSGLVLRRSTLNLRQARKYIGINYMHQVLLAQNLTNGDTLCTSKIFCNIARPSEKIKSHILSSESKYLKAGLLYNHLLNRIPLVEQTIRIITDIMFKYPAAQNVLIKKQMRLAGIYFAEIFEKYPNLFFIFLMKFFKRNRRIRNLKLLFIFLRGFFYNIYGKIKSKIKI